METAPWMDWLLGGVALSILAGGLWMLLSGVSGMGNK
jgi:hypothetical protein